MVAAIYDFIIEKGASKTITLTIKNSETGVVVDLTDCTASMNIKSCSTSTTVLDTLTTENNRITITGSEGKIELSFPSSTSLLYDFTRGVYDLYVTFAEDDIRRFLEGQITITDNITEL